MDKIYRKKIYIPNQPVDRVKKYGSIIFHYKYNNDVFDIDIFEIGNEGKIRIAQSLHGLRLFIICLDGLGKNKN